MGRSFHHPVMLNELVGAEPVVVLYASISVLNWMRAASGSQCKEIKRDVTCSFWLVEEQSCCSILNHL